MISIEPCPGCGATEPGVRVVTFADTQGDPIHVLCNSCKMHGPEVPRAVLTDPRIQVEHAIKVWNALPRDHGPKIQHPPKPDLFDGDPLPAACGFCGSQHTEAVQIQDMHSFAVVCRDCRSRGGISRRGGIDGAVESWNLLMNAAAQWRESGKVTMPADDDDGVDATPENLSEWEKVMKQAFGTPHPGIEPLRYSPVAETAALRLQCVEIIMKCGDPPAGTDAAEVFAYAEEMFRYAMSGEVKGDEHNVD